MSSTMTGQQTGRSLVPAILFEKLVARLVVDEGLSQTFAIRVMDQALAFLGTSAAHRGEPLVPSRVVDPGWHAFLLHTRDYREFCRRIAGRFIDHVPTPAPLRASGEPGLALRRTLDVFVEWERRAVRVVAGDQLAHTDLHSLNLLVGDRVRVVDWAWSRAATPSLDASFLVARLIDAGHSPDEAERWADETAAWKAAPEDDKTAFAVAVLGIWEFLQRDQPLPHRKRLTDAARRWARHRLG